MKCDIWWLLQHFRPIKGVSSITCCYLTLLAVNAENWTKDCLHAKHALQGLFPKLDTRWRSMPIILLFFFPSWAIHPNCFSLLWTFTLKCWLQLFFHFQRQCDSGKDNGSGKVSNDFIIEQECARRLAKSWSLSLCRRKVSTGQGLTPVQIAKLLPFL